jgi:hypothetical protein
MNDTPASARRRLQWDAEKRAQALAGVFAELSGLSPSAAAEELNRRGVKAPAGGKWHAVQVVRVRNRLKAAQ